VKECKIPFVPLLYMVYFGKEEELLEEGDGL
jgi:hypothetical protein